MKKAEFIKMVAQDNNMKQADVREFVDNLFDKSRKGE